MASETKTGGARTYAKLDYNFPTPELWSKMARLLGEMNEIAADYEAKEKEYNAIFTHCRNIKEKTDCKDKCEWISTINGCVPIEKIRDEEKKFTTGYAFALA